MEAVIQEWLEAYEMMTLGRPQSAHDRVYAFIMEELALAHGPWASQAFDRAVNEGE